MTPRDPVKLLLILAAIFAAIAWHHRPRGVTSWTSNSDDAYREAWFA